MKNLNKLIFRLLKVAIISIFVVSFKYSNSQNIIKYHQDSYIFDTIYKDGSMVKPILNSIDSISISGIEILIEYHQRIFSMGIPVFGNEQYVNFFYTNYSDTIIKDRTILIGEHCFSDSLESKNAFRNIVDFCNKYDESYGYSNDVFYIINLSNRLLVIKSLNDRTSLPDNNFFNLFIEKLKILNQIQISKVSYPISLNENSIISKNSVIKTKKWLKHLN